MKLAKLELWCWDPVDCVCELIRNPTFKNMMAYALEHAYRDKEGKCCIYAEMWTCDCWWDTQGKLPKGATIAPLILASDKTSLCYTLTAWPVYLTIGNIKKATHRQPQMHTAILLDCFSKATCSIAGYQLFHECMCWVLQPLVVAGHNGVDMVLHLILAAYVADHPKQCLIACMNHGKPLSSLLQDPEQNIIMLKKKQTGHQVAAYTHEGLCPMYHPFWADLPFSDIFASIIPNILHQLHKGVFHNHLLKLCTEIAGEKEINKCYETMTNYPGLQYFSQGIRLYLNGWRIFMGVLMGAVQPKLAQAAHAVLDFIYYPQFHSTLHSP
ncbi:hypothetical protein F4604DRAFT_1879259 [Suillus subluteus]|nr:hypothetical protein F4604DRAFT_1879259 [Suillus subluteus]